MILGLEVEVWFVTVLTLYDVVVLGGSLGNGVVREVGEERRGLVQFRVELLEIDLDVLELLGQDAEHPRSPQDAPWHPLCRWTLEARLCSALKASTRPRSAR